MMTGKYITIISSLIILPALLAAQNESLPEGRWKRERVSPGLFRIYTHSCLQDSLRQNINILLVNPRRRKIFLLYNPLKNLPVSQLAERPGSLAAVNAGFFSIREGFSVTYIKTGFRISDSDTASRWPRVVNMNGSIVVRDDGRPVIMKSMSNGWYDSCRLCRDVLVSGPLLISGGKMVTLPGTSLVVNRHPRTAMGIDRHGWILFVTIDGRTDQAAGLTLPGLARLMKSLGCRDAINLDGGGSTTMWIRGRPSGGVVNMPCDNGKFDHDGERPVADIIVIK